MTDSRWTRTEFRGGPLDGEVKAMPPEATSRLKYEAGGLRHIYQYDPAERAYVYAGEDK